MKKKASFLTICVVAVLLSAFLSVRGDDLYGEKRVVNVPEFALKTFGDRTWQKSYESWRNQNFGFRNDLVRLKNSIYDWVNFEQFHLAYNRSIVQGKHGNIFEVGYLRNQFYWTDLESVKKLVKSNVEAISKTSQNMDSLGIPFVFVMLPNKASQFEDEWPFLWDLQNRFNKKKINFYSLYEEELTKAKIPFVNLQRYFDSKREQNRFWFPTTGTHWSLAMAQSSVEPIVSLLDKSYGTTLFSPVLYKLENNKEARYEETDIWKLMNRLPIDQKISKQNFFVYGEIDVQNQNPLPSLLYGDSFTNQLQWAFVSTGIIDVGRSKYVENRVFTADELISSLMDKKLFIVGYSLGALSTKRIAERDLKQINNILAKEPYYLLETGWHEKEKNGVWSSEKVSIAFLTTKDLGNRDITLKLKVVSILPSVRKIEAFINDSQIALDLNQIKRTKELVLHLPREFIKNVGESNFVEFRITGAATPLSLNINRDRRLLGFKIEPNSLELTSCN